MSRIRIMIVDDHAMWRVGLQSVLDVVDDLELIGEAGSGLQALEKVPQLKPDVILMDLYMPEMDGPKVIKEVKQRFPAVKILALTSFTDPSLVKRALQNGAESCLLKDVAPMVLVQAIRDTYTGQQVLAPYAERTMSLKENEFGLTDREFGVLKLMTEGMNNPEIARHLSISPLTVKTHVRNIFAKLGVSSRTEAVIIALRRNIFGDA